MTVSSTTNIVVYEGNGATTTFDYNFLIPEQSDAIITYTDTDGVETVLNTNQYSITGIDDDNGGTVTYPLSGSPIALGTFLSIRRELELVQDTNLVNQDGFYPQVVESALDYLTMLVQQISTLNSQAIRVPASEEPPNELPAAALRANQSLIFDSDGQPTVGSPADAPISVAMQPVVAASTLLSARTLMGVGYLPEAVTTNQTVTIDDITTRFMATGALTFTMPDSTQVPNGFSFSVYALTLNCTLDPVGTDTIYGFGLGNNATVAAGTVAEIVTDGAGNWWLQTIITADDYVGAIRAFGGFDAPSVKYDLCDGGLYARADFPALFTATTMSVTVTKTNGNPVLGGFTSAQTAKLAAGMPVEGSGIPAGAVILTTPSSGDTSITLDMNSTNGTTVVATIIPWGMTTSANARRPDLRGVAPAGAELASNATNRMTSTYFGAADRIGRVGGTESLTIAQGNLPNVNFTVTDNRTWSVTALGPGGAGGPAPGAVTAPAPGALSVTPAGAAPTAASGGSGTPASKMQPTVVVNYFVRVLP